MLQSRCKIKTLLRNLFAQSNILYTFAKKNVMPVSKNALIRYKTIDRCLRNRYRRWTLEDLIEACSDALYEYEGRDEGVSRRTVQLDIQMMRSDKLGYNAPIKVVDRKYYYLRGSRILHHGVTPEGSLCCEDLPEMPFGEIPPLPKKRPGRKGAFWSLNRERYEEMKEEGGKTEF